MSYTKHPLVLGTLALGLLASCGRGAETAAEVAADVEDAAGEALAGVEAAANINYIISQYAEAMAASDAETAEEYLAEVSEEMIATLQETFGDCVTPYPEDDDPTTVGAAFDCSSDNSVYGITGTISATLTPEVESLQVVGASLVMETTDLLVAETSIAASALLDFDKVSSESLVDLDMTVEASDIATLAVTLDGVAAAAQANCTSLDGAVSITSSERSIDVTADGFERCQGECPAAGASLSITISGDNGTETFSVTMNGSNEAEITTSEATSTVAVDC